MNIINQKDQRNLFIFIGLMGAIASGFTIWNHLENHKLRKVQMKLAEQNMQKLQRETPGSNKNTPT